MATSSSEPTDILRRLEQELSESLQRGEQPNLADWKARYPELASDLERLFQATLSIRCRPVIGVRAVPENPEQALGLIGDYDILREVGRGGMEAGYVLMHHGRCLRELRQPFEAESMFRRAADIQRRTKGSLARTLCNLAQVIALEQQRWADAEPVLSECLQVCKTTDSNKNDYAQSLDLYVDVLLRFGKSDVAVASLREHVPEIDRRPRLDVHDLFHQARRRGLLCTLWPDQPLELRQRELAQAMSSLQAALQGGFCDLEAIRTNPHLAPLRELPDFAKLVEQK